MTVVTPDFHTLEAGEANELLARGHVGRIAYSLHDRIDIEPIHYVFDGGWIFGRTSMGTKLSHLAHHPWCAFEVDEVRDTFHWKSVVVKGSLHLLDPETGSDTYLRALGLLRDLIPGTFTPDDPTPQRTVIFGIHVDEVTGRAALPKPR